MGKKGERVKKWKGEKMAITPFFATFVQ
jgi:hypothetical protein